MYLKENRELKAIERVRKYCHYFCKNKLDGNYSIIAERCNWEWGKIWTGPMDPWTVGQFLDSFLDHFKGGAGDQFSLSAG